MDRHKPFVATIYSSSSEKVRAWTAAIEGAGLNVHPVGVEGRIDVVVTDDSTAWPAGASRRCIGLVAVGCPRRADVLLPSSASADAVAAAAEQAGKLARLRRRLVYSERRRQRLHELALRDELTGLPNLRAWRSRYREFCRRARQGEPSAMAIVDVDQFKLVNDRWGHRAGNRLLRAIGRAVLRSVGPNGFAARLGGDEFGLLLAGDDAVDPTGALEHLRAAIQEATTRVVVGGATVSAGYLVIDSAATSTPTQWLDRVDTALHDAKRAGRDRVRDAASDSVRDAADARG